MKTNYLEFDSHKVRFCEWGDKNNPDIVFLHGLGCTSLSFIEIAESLKCEFHILSIDLPGHGQSSAFVNETDYESDFFIKWLSEVLGRTAKDSFCIVAHSWGGSIALHYAARYPKIVTKIVLLDGGYYDPQTRYDYYRKLYDNNEIHYKPICSQSELVDYIEQDYEDYVFENKKSFLADEKSNHTRWSSLLEQSVYDLMREEDGKIKWHVNKDTARAVIISLYTMNKKIEFQNIKSEILLLYVDSPNEDLAINIKMVNDFRKRINVETKLYKDTTHMIHIDKPNEVVEDIRNWLMIDSDIMIAI